MWQVSGVRAVELDVRLGLHPNRFTPDLVGLRGTDDFALAVDFESPNSSDARVPKKDVRAYLNWARASNNNVEYLIVTSLPDDESRRWQLRYTDKNGTNPVHRGRRDQVRKNPFRYWYRFYRRELEGIPEWKSAPISFANFDGRAILLIDPETVG
jgi:hypothetical protein